MTRVAALRRVALLYLLVQLVSWLVLCVSCSGLVRGGLWIHGALGPLAAFGAVPRFRYHSLPGNVAFVAMCLALLIAPFAHALRPGRIPLAVSLLALVVWVLFGLALSVHHV